jgi:Toprim domain
LQKVAIPDRVRNLYLFCDNDDRGRAEAQRTLEVHRNRRRVVLLFPPPVFDDWNDALQAERTTPVRMREAA